MVAQYAILSETEYLHISVRKPRKLEPVVCDSQLAVDEDRSVTKSVISEPLDTGPVPWGGCGGV